MLTQRPPYVEIKRTKITKVGGFDAFVLPETLILQR